MNKPNGNGLRENLPNELCKYFPETTESRITIKKPSFFRVLKNNLECALCKEKNCPARYYPNQEAMILRYNGNYHPAVCRKKYGLGKKKKQD